MERLFVNVYAVTRNYGGPEEGGWYYNAGTPLASIPILAKKLPGHQAGHCGRCDEARKGNGEFCVETPEQYREDFTLEENIEAFGESQQTSHLLPVITKEELEAMIVSLKEMFDDMNWGNIYSVRGGSEVQVMVQEDFAEYWPRENPHYE